MYAPITDIISILLEENRLSDEEMLVFCTTRTDVQFQTSGWNLSEDDITAIMHRMDSAYKYVTEVDMIHSTTEALIAERRAARHVTVSAAALEKIMQLADGEIQRLSGCTTQAGENGETFLEEENDAMRHLKDALST